MKSVWLTLCMAMLLVCHGWSAGTEVQIEVSSNAAGDVSYNLSKGGTEPFELKSLEQIEEWLRIAKPDRRDLVLVRSDNRTPFRTISDLLQMMKSTGVKRWAVICRDGSSLSGKSENIQRQSR